MKLALLSYRCGYRLVCVCVWRNFLLLILTAAFLLSIPSPVSAYYTNMPASVVVGQSNFSSSGTSVTQSTLGGSGRGAFVDPKGRLILADELNNRVLIWNTIPTSNGTPANLVLGQPDFVSNTTDNGGVSASALDFPTVVFSDATRLLVADQSNDRVLIWNTFPTANNQAADVVVGQTDMVTDGGTNRPCDTVHLDQPNGVWIYQNKLLVGDASHNRMLIWNSVPTSNGVVANTVLGQNDLTTCTAPSSPSQSNMSSPRHVMVDTNGKLFVADRSQNRVLIWNSIPITNNQAADVVVGQANFTSKLTPNPPAANTANIPFAYSTGDRLFVGDTNNRRLLVFNTIPTSNGASADIVLGQADFISNTTYSISSSSFNPSGIPFEYGNKLIIADATNNRLLIFTNTTNSPRLGISSIGGVPLDSANPPAGGQGRLRISGNLSVDGGLYNLWKLEASVNGGGYAPVSFLSNSVVSNSTHDPGKINTVSSTFYHDFEPWNLNGQPLGNGDKNEWINNQKDMLSSYGYTLKLKGYNNNTDSNEVFFLSKPLTIVNPTNATTSAFSVILGTPTSRRGTPESDSGPFGNTQGRQARMTQEAIASSAILPTLSRTPTITFSVNSKQRNELKENLVHYEVWINKKCQMINDKCQMEESNWEKYIDSIPIDYDTVRDYEDNLRKGQYEGTKGEGNGTYENNNLIVTFTKNSSEISVRKKGQSSQRQSLGIQGLSLSSGIYQLKVVAVDKANHPQDSDNEITVKIIGSPQINNPKNLSITTEWFPLQINSIQGSPTGVINQQTTQTTFQTSTSNPTINGIAFSDSTITLTITDQHSGEYRTYTTQAKDSKWSITPQLYSTSFLDVSVESVEGKYNELPTVMINVFEP